MFDKFIEDLKSFTLYRLIYSKMLTKTIISIAVFIILAIFFYANLINQNFFWVIINLIFLSLNFVLLSTQIKKVVSTYYPNEKYSFFNFNFIFNVRKKNLKEYFEDSNNGFTEVFSDNEKFDKFIDYFERRIERYKFKGVYVLAFIGSISGLAFSNLISQTYNNTDIMSAINITLYWIIGSIFLGLYLNFIRKNIIASAETKYNYYKEILTIMKELRIYK